MKLYLMRHGQAASFEVDPKQGLSNEGKAAIEQLAHIKTAMLAILAYEFEKILAIWYT